MKNLPDTGAGDGERDRLSDMTGGEIVGALLCREDPSTPSGFRRTPLRVTDGGVACAGFSEERVDEILAFAHR